MIIPIFSHADGLQIHVYTYKQNHTYVNQSIVWYTSDTFVIQLIEL